MTDYTKEEVLALASRFEACALEMWRLKMTSIEANELQKAGILIRAYAEVMDTKPVAWRYKRSVEPIWHTQVEYPDFGGVDGWDVEPLYTSPIAKNVVPLNDDQILEIIKECFPWQTESAINDLLTHEKSVPLFPQATYDVPSYRAERFVRAVERRIHVMLTGSSIGEANDG